MTQRLGASAISAEAAQAEADLRAALAVPEGVVQALIDRATRGMVVLAVLEAHIEAEVHAGVAFSEVPVAVRWPGFNNSVVRSLQALAQVLPKTTPHEAERQRVVDLLDTLRQARPGTPGASADQQQAQPDESAHEPDGGDCEERDG